MFRWMIYECRPDGTEIMHTAEALAAIHGIGIRYGAGRAVPSESAACLILAWLSVVYCIQDDKCRDAAKLEEVYNNAFKNREFLAWNVGCGMCKYLVRPICNFDKGFDDPIEPSSITFPTYEEGLRRAIEAIY